VNIAYFDCVDSEEKAYFLGFLFADGTHLEPHRRLLLELQERDSEIPAKLSVALLGHERLTRRLRNTKCGHKAIRQKAQVGFSISNEHLSSTLSRLGLTSRKSFTCEMPALQPSLVRHFVRGYFDGDGCLSVRSSKGAERWIISILSSLPMCQSIAQNSSVVIGFVPHITKRGNIHEIIVSGNRQVKKFMDWIYAGSTISLGRKREKYRQLLASIDRIDSKPRYSKYVGITFDKSRNKWAAILRVKGKTLHLGRFLTETLAIEARTAANHQILAVSSSTPVSASAQQAF
jgi:hypothetical protein